MALTKGDRREGLIEDCSRSFTIAIDEYDESHLEARIYHDGNKKTADCHGLIEMMTVINRLLDGGERPMMTMALRTFQEGGGPEEESAACENFKRPGDECLDFINVCDFQEQASTALEKSGKALPMGKRATFRIFVKYRHHACLQGILFCAEKKKTLEFDSFLQMVRAMERLMDGSDSEKMCPKRQDVCRVAVDSGIHGDLTGSLQSISGNYQCRFYHTMGLANLLMDLLGADEGQDETWVQEKKLVPWEALDMPQKDGKKATFVVKIRFRKYATWQGRIYWREEKISRPFRSFMEMLMLMASVIDHEKENQEYVQMER